MIKNFEKVKGQLAELADLLNKFNSENVQLRLIELLFAPQEKKETEVAEIPSMPVQKRRPGRPAKLVKEKETKAETIAKSKEKKVTRKKKAIGRPGPSRILDKLIKDGFFQEKRTIRDIVNHLRDEYKLNYQSTDLSGTLGKLAKEGVLEREMNQEKKQFEYIIAGLSTGHSSISMAQDEISDSPHQEM